MKKKTVDSVLAIPEIELKPQFWLDLSYLGGVDYRFGWKIDEELRSYTVVFRGDPSTNGLQVRGPAVQWHEPRPAAPGSAGEETPAQCRTH